MSFLKFLEAMGKRRYEDMNVFKLFMLDVGLMGAMAETLPESMLVGDGIFSEYKDAFTELYVFTQLESLGLPLYYYLVDKSTIEIDFMTQWNPGLKATRYSMLPYEEQECMTCIPLYASLVWKK